MPIDSDQLAFLRLHQLTHDFVQTWRHLFQGAMIRAETAKGRKVTLQRDAVQGLVDAGLMTPSYGGSFSLTELGRGI